MSVKSKCSAYLFKYHKGVYVLNIKNLVHFFCTTERLIKQATFLLSKKQIEKLSFIRTTMNDNCEVFSETVIFNFVHIKTIPSMIDYKLNPDIIPLLLTVD